jgi:hypothetical protein
VSITPLPRAHTMSTPLSIPGILTRYPAASPSSPSSPHLPLFLCGHLPSPRVLVLIGGLGDTVGSVAYTRGLVTACEDAGWGLALPCLSSAGSGWGLASLDRDVDELRGVVVALRRQGEAPGSMVVYSEGETLGAERERTAQANRPSCSWATLQAHKTS